MKIISARRILSLLAGASALLVRGPSPLPTAAHAAGGGQAGVIPEIRIDREVGAAREFALDVGQNRLLVLSEGVTRVSVADPRVADLKVITPTQLLLTARGAGTTDLTLWNRKDDPLVMSLVVTRNLEPLRHQLAELFPNEHISVAPAAGDLVVLSGDVSDVRVPERAAEVAKLHAEKVANLIHVNGNQQVQLEVKFAEVSRSGLRQMGFNFFQQDKSGRYVAGAANPGTNASSFLAVPGTGAVPVPPIYPASPGAGFSLFFSGLSKLPFSVMLGLLEQNGLAKTLAEPTLVAMSGQEARFLAGGEFPIPMSTGLGAITVTWKKFGIILAFTPTVISDGVMHLKMSTEVSDVDPSRAVIVSGFSIPGLTSRQSETTVRLGDGQSFAIAGLLSSRMQSQISKIPLLGDLPILGALFRSVDYSRNESELLVVVTAHLTKPLAPHEVPALPTDDELNDPGDLELFLLGSEGTSRPSVTSAEAAERVSPPPAPPAPPPSSSPAAPNKDKEPRSKAKRGPDGEIGFIRVDGSPRARALSSASTPTQAPPNP